MARPLSSASRHAKGTKVTVPRLMIHTTILDRHVSHRVRRQDGSEIIVGEGEDTTALGPLSEPLDTHVSYLVGVQWDGTEVWVEEADVIAGHDLKAKMPGHD